MAGHIPSSKPRVGVRLRVLASMGLAMTLFLLALLFIVYYRVVQNVAASEARSIVISLIPLVVFILIICGLLFFVLTNRLVLAPIKRIRDAALAVSHGQLDTVISTAQNDEIGDLARSVDQMATALRHDIQSLKEVDQLKSEFIAISSHNLRTPLASIEGGLDMLQSASLDNQTKKMLQIIRASAANLIKFSEDMLTIADIENKQGDAGQFAPISLSEIMLPLVADTIMMARDRQLTFINQLDASDVQVRANASLLRLAFRNLLENACKFTAAGGTVTLAATRQDDRIMVSVKDTGIGIAPSELPNLFTKFHRGTTTLAYNYEGIGIGLYISKLIFDRHDATVSVNSEPNKGTEFIVSLPCTVKAAAEPAAARQEKSAQ